jgi:nitrogen fixation/metabolism regulation signal transduction histidine kinase
MKTLKPNRWTWILLGLTVTGLGMVLAFLLAFATQNRERYEPYFQFLFWANVTVASLLGLVILLALLRLALRIKRRKFGNQLLLKLVGIFATVALLPGLLIYGVSYQFVSRSIETWFDVRVEGALEAGLNLGRTTIDTLKQDLSSQTKLGAERLASAESNSSPLLDLERLREQLSAERTAIVLDTGLIETQVGSRKNPSLRPERISSSLIQTARNQGVVAIVEGLDDDLNPSITALAWIPDQSFSLQSTDRFLLIQQELPSSLMRNATSVEQAYREYQERSLGREGLRRMYIGTLTLTLLLAVFMALLLSAVLGQQLAQPLVLLAEGVREVARGDLQPKPFMASNDELGGLTRDFANMTQQLADARQQTQQSAQQLDNARARVQTILDNLSSGVIVFNAQGQIETVNPGATRILRLPLSAYIGQPLSALPTLLPLAQNIEERFNAYASDPEPGERQQWQESFERDISNNNSDQESGQTLLVRGADLMAGSRLIVFDDITELVSAQRAKAWGDVARRVAHEIKNPLTPIQLSAERLQMKLENKLDTADQQLLHRSVNTIVAQVHSLKTLINEFRDFARLPVTRLQALDLNALIQDVMGLYGQAIDSGMLRLNLAADMPRIQGDPTLLRQVVHNLVQNAMDAVSEHPHQLASGEPQIEVLTQLRRDEAGQVTQVILKVRDSGAGFPEKILKRAFEPYVTTKAHGTGLGLAVVRKIADEHQAIIKIKNLSEITETSSLRAMTGAQVSLSFSKLLLHNTPSA